MAGGFKMLQDILAGRIHPRTPGEPAKASSAPSIASTTGPIPKPANIQSNPIEAPMSYNDASYKWARSHRKFMSEAGGV